MKSSIWIAILNIVLTCGLPVSAAEMGSDVDAILHKFVQALGGRGALTKIESRQVTAEMETMGAQGEYIWFTWDVYTLAGTLGVDSPCSGAYGRRFVAWGVQRGLD